MADRTYRGGRDRYDRSYNRQAEQFDTSGYGWRDDERGYGQMGDGWRDEDYGQFDTFGQSYGRDRDAARDWGRDPSYSRRSEFRGGGRGYARPGSDTFERGAGTQLAANHGEWRDGYGTTPSRENRDYRGTWGSSERSGWNRSGGRDPNERGFLERAGDTIAHWLGDDADYRRGEHGFRGHGPSGYTRSDDRIREDVCDALTDDWRVDARQVSVTVSGGEITLDGTVPSREQKRRAEDCVENVSGVRHVQNNLRVQERSGWDGDDEFGAGRGGSTGTQA